MLRVALVTGQTPFPIVHFKTLVPVAKPTTALVAALGVEMVAVPDKTDHVPVPTVGTLPLNVVEGELMHSAWLIPTVAADGGGVAVITTVLLVEALVQAVPATTFLL